MKVTCRVCKGRGWTRSKWKGTQPLTFARRTQCPYCGGTGKLRAS